MPTLDELLNTSNEVATCTVNPDTREIIVPEKYKILGVFSDEKVTKIPFTCPKVVGNNVDLTEYKLYINYQNAIGGHNAYLVDDVEVSGDNITFSWLLSRDVTLSSGMVKYSLCAKKLNGDLISNEWNTTIANGVVIQGLEVTQAIVEENPDIIEAILSKAHTHANKSVLDKFAETDGKPTYDGKTLGGGDASVTEANITSALGYKPVAPGDIPTVPTKTSQLTNDSGFLTSHQSLAAYRTAAAQDEIDSGKVDKVTGKGLSSNDYTATAKAKVDAIPANPKYTDTVYDDTALKERVATIEGKESAWDAKSDFSGSYNDLTDKPTIPTEVTPLIGTTNDLTPTQVYEAVSAGIPVKVQYTDSTYGLISFTAFTVAESINAIASQMIGYYNGVYILAELLGDKSNNVWSFISTTLAQKIDIPSELPNPNALTFTGAVTGTYDGSAAVTVNIPSAVTDTHINELISTALNAIGVAEEGAY